MQNQNRKDFKTNIENFIKLIQKTYKTDIKQQKNTKEDKLFLVEYGITIKLNDILFN